MKDDAELYAQVKRDEDTRAALQLLTRLHEQTTGGGENAMIRKGAYEKRLSEMVRKIREETATGMSDRANRAANTKKPRFHGFFDSGGEENRTPVRRFSCMVFSERRQGFDFPSPRRPMPGLWVQ